MLSFRAGVTFTECLVCILLVGMISIIAFSAVSMALTSNNLYMYQNNVSNFMNFVANEVYIRGVRDSSVTTVADELTRKYYNLSKQANLSDVYPRVVSIQVISQVDIPGTNLPAAKVLEIIILKDPKGRTERIILIQGRP